MEVACPQCARRLLIDDARVPAGSFSVRCPQCQATIQLAGKAPAASERQPEPESRPPVEAGAPAIEELLRILVDRKGSDLHMSVGSPPMIRHDGEIKIAGRAAGAHRRGHRARCCCRSRRRANKEEFAARHDTDFAYEIPGLARFRGNLFMDRKGLGGVFRVIPSKILTAEEMNAARSEILAALPAAEGARAGDRARPARASPPRCAR